VWTPGGQLRCEEYYTDRQASCNESCGHEYDSCVTQCQGDAGCVKQCESNDDYCDDGCHFTYKEQMLNVCHVAVPITSELK
jgi:hypothetical protein